MATINRADPSFRAAVLALLSEDLNQFLDASMLDPDIARRGPEFQAGYREGFTEAMAAVVSAKLLGK